MVRLEYLVSCNMQKSGHQLRQAQICKEDPDRGMIGFYVYLTHHVEVFERAPQHGGSTLFFADGTPSSLEGTPDRKKRMEQDLLWSPVRLLAEDLHQVAFWLQNPVTEFAIECIFCAD